MFQIHNNIVVKYILFTISESYTIIHVQKLNQQESFELDTLLKANSIALRSNIH